MVLLDSPLAVALLVVAMIFVVAGLASSHARLYRVAGLLPDDERAPFHQHVAVSAAVVLLVVLFWLVLASSR